MADRKLLKPLLEKGWYFHPVYAYKTEKKLSGDRPARKSPLLPKDWQGNSSKDYDQIKKWYFDYKKQLGEAPALGVVLGKKSGVFVLDVDCKGKDNGLESLKRLEDKYGSLRQDNFYVNTPSGGVHIYFKLPEGKEIINKNKIKEYPGIEIKSTGTYVLLMDDGYNDINSIDNILPCPEWIFDLYKAPESASDDQEEECTESDVGNERNNYLTSRCGELRMAGISEEVALEQLLKLNNELYASHDNGPLPEKEVRTICKSVYKYDKPEETSDYAIARKIVEILNKEFCYVTEFKEFYCYRDGVWVQDRDNLTGKILFEVIEDLLKVSTSIKSKKGRQALNKKIKNLCNNGGHVSITNVVKEITARSIDNFDIYPNLLCLNNGVIDLKTQKFYDHNKEFYMTKKMDVDYLPGSTCPKYEKYLHTTFGGNVELSAFVERLVGVAMTGRAGEQIFPILWGKGENGKTVFTELVCKIFSTYADVMKGDVLIKKKNGGSNDYMLADLKSKRIVFAAETDKDAVLDPSLVKYVTGGDLIKARPIYGKPFSFSPTHIVFMMTNNMPKIRDMSHGMWRRVKLIPFEHRVDPKEKILKYEDVLFKEEASGIFNSWLKALKDYQENGLNEPKKVTDATQGYKNEQDVAYRFINENCLRGADFKFNANSMYKVFETWCKDNGEKWGDYASSMELLHEIQRLIPDLKPEHTRNGNFWVGLGLKETSDF